MVLYFVILAILNLILFLHVTNGQVIRNDVELESEAEHFGERCTALAIGRKATTDGSTVVSHGNDCPRCDFRLAYIPARDYKEDEKKPIYMAKNDYPRFVGENVAVIYESKHLEKGFTFKWNSSEPMGHIPQVKHTYAFVDGAYALMNEHQLAVGESTCDARLGLKGAPIAFGGKALFDVAALSRLAMERCKTARCAVQLMGSLAVKYGFYGGQLTDWTPKLMTDEAEGGEALTVADPEEVWVFQVSPDDTGKSAVWVAQRVPDEEVHVVTNTFSVGKVDLRDSENFLGSSNLYDVAQRNGFWDPDSGIPFDFTQVYRSTKGHAIGNRTLIDRRKWAVFRKVCPSCNFDPYLKHATDDSDIYFPFSIKPDRLLTLEDIFALHRDIFQNSPFDLSHAVVAGAWGDPIRAVVPRQHPFNDTKEWVGVFERAVSQTWTSYTSITQSRSWLPDTVGGRIWYGPHDAMTTLFVPIYPGASTAVLPRAYSVGSLYRVDVDSFWWAVCLTANYMARYYNVLLPNVTEHQLKIEGEILKEAAKSEAEAVSNPEHGMVIMSNFQDQTAEFALREWWGFFFRLVAYFHDGTRFFPAPTLATRGVPYPAWWLEAIGPEGLKTAEWSDRHPNKAFRTPPHSEGTPTTTFSTTTALRASSDFFPFQTLTFIIMGIVIGFFLRPCFDYYVRSKRYMKF